MPVFQYRPPFFYGWIVLFTAAWSAFFTGPGQTYSYSIFIDSFIQEFGWSRTLVSLLYTTATLISGFLMSVIGRMIDRFGARRMCIGSGLLLALACLWSSFVVNPMMLFIGFFLGRFAGQGTLSLSADTLPPKWFVKRRALAIMLAGIGYTLSNGVYPLLNNYLVNAFGWRNAFRILAGSLCVAYVPVVILFMVSRPEDIGLNPDGLTGDDDNMAGSFQDEECSFSQAQAMRTWVFWILAFCFFQLSLGATGVTFHFLSIFAERGYSDAFAAQVLSVKPLIGFAATILVGLFLDRLRRPQFVLTAALVAQCAGSVMLVFLSGTAMAYVYTVLSGVSEAVIMLSIGEVFYLRWKDVNLNDGTISINGSYGPYGFTEPKTETSKTTIPIIPELITILKEWRLKSQSSRWVFPIEKRDMPISNIPWRKNHYYPLLEKVGLSKIRFHDLRHTFISILLAKGVNPRDVQSLARHASIIQTNKYSHEIKDRLQGVVKDLRLVTSKAQQSRHNRD